MEQAKTKAKNNSKCPLVNLPPRLVGSPQPPIQLEPFAELWAQIEEGKFNPSTDTLIRVDLIHVTGKVTWNLSDQGVPCAVLHGFIPKRAIDWYARIINNEWVLAYPNAK